MRRNRLGLLGSTCLAIGAAAIPNHLHAQWAPCGSGGPVECAPTGNVGIGTTSPTTALQVNGDIYATDTGFAGYGFRIGASPSNYSDQFVYDGVNTYLDYKGPLYLRANSGAINVLTATASGNVGIGTTSPAYLLDISGTGIAALRINGTAFNPNSNNSQLRFAGGKNGELWAIGPDVAANNGSKDFTFWALGGVGAMMTLQNSTGNVGIGTTNPQHLLHVAGTIGAEEVIVSSTGADYVFDPGYRLAPLAEVAGYISEHHHLPDILSASEMQQKGANVGEMQARLLAKIEVLTLNMIQAEERSNRLEQQNRDPQERINRLESKDGQAASN